MKAEVAALRERELFAALTNWNVPGTITIGGYGASARSIPRYSHDIDFLIPGTSLMAAQNHLSSAGLSLVIRNPVVEQNYGGAFEQWSGGRTHVTVELLIDSVQDRIFRTPLPYKLLAERSDILPIQGISTGSLRLPVACAEALIAMKVQPMRSKDRGDICCLANGPIDEKNLRKVMAPLIKAQPALLAAKLDLLAKDLSTEAAANALLGPRIAGPPSRREPVVRSARQLVRTIGAWL